MNERIDFYFPIDPNWTEEDLLAYYYKKVQFIEAIYRDTDHLKYLKKSKTVYNFIQRKSQNIIDCPLIYFLLILVNGAYEKAKESNLAENEILVFRFFNLEPWPPTSMQHQFWYTFINVKENFEN